MLNLRSFTDFVRAIQGKFSKELPEVDPTIKSSFARAVNLSTASGAVSLQEGISEAVKQSFPQTADDDFLELFGAMNNVTLFPASEASGLASVEGILGTAIPADTTLTYSGNSYLVENDSTAQNYSDSISLSYSGGIVTAVTSITHNLGTGFTVAISGATQTDYNGSFVITAIDSNTFTYDLIAGSLTTDNGIYSATFAILNIESSLSGSDQNILAGGVLSISITGLESSAISGVDGIEGGLDEETNEEFRVRVLESYNLTPGISTPPSIIFSAKSIFGNTRVFLVRPTGTASGTPGVAGYKPEIGETVLYILRDNDATIIPSSAQLEETKEKIISDGHWPSFIPDAYLYVMAPTLVNADFVFSSITPNTLTMQNAISDQLDAFFEDNSEIEGTIELDTIKAFLRQIQDPTTGEFLISYTLTTPSGDLVAGSGEIYVKGSVSF